MPNKSHFNSGHRMMNRMKKSGQTHSSYRNVVIPMKTWHACMPGIDCSEVLAAIPDGSIQLIVCDPPYNLDIAVWDTHKNYIDWASQWLSESCRVLSPSGNLVVFGGLQYQTAGGGDLLEIMHHVRHRMNLRLVNHIVWYYKNGMSAHRFFANRHEEIAWYAKTEKYTFNLDAVRVPFDEETKKVYLRDNRLNPASVEKGKNPTNVWEIGRLNGNSTERVGHPTQKPRELIRRLVRGLSNPGDIVLDFFAGSGSTTAVCIEEARHSITSDSDTALRSYFKMHLKNMRTTSRPHEVVGSVGELLKSVMPGSSVGAELKF